MVASRFVINCGRCLTNSAVIRCVDGSLQKWKCIRYCSNSASQDGINKVSTNVVNKTDVSQPKTYLELLEMEAREFLDNLSPELIDRREQLFVLMEMLRCQGYEIPETISDMEMASILKEWSDKSPMQKLLHAQRKIVKAEQRFKPLASLDEDYFYALKSTLDTWQAFSAIRSYMFGPPLIIDAGYPLPAWREPSVVHMIVTMQRYNIINKQGYHLHVTGMKHNTQLMKMKDWNITDHYMIDFHEKDFWDIFPRDKLVYLSPDAPEGKEYSADKIYIVGGLPDFHTHREASYARAKDLGISCISFPFNYYFKRQKHFLNRNLLLIPTMKVLLKAQQHNDWGKALIDLYGHKYKTLKPLVYIDSGDWKVKKSISRFSNDYAEEQQKRAQRFHKSMGFKF